jgi:hypothetical protein
MKTSPGRIIAAAAIVAAGFCFVLGLYAFGLTEKNATERDYIEYWAAGQQLVHGANPYDLAAIFQVERAVGLDDREPKVTLSPPIVLLLVLPLGFLGVKAGLILWLFLILACLVASISLIWRLHGSPPTGYHWIGMAFAPAVACLLAAQISLFLLLAIVLFLYWHRSRPLLAGVALLPCVLKPHLFLPFAVVLLLWIANRRAYRVLLGFGAAFAASCALTLGLDRHAWSEYELLSHSNNILHLFVPTLSSFLRFQVAPNAVWLQFLPAAASCVWAIWYFLTRRAGWDWMQQGLLVMLVSSLCAPYAFFYDEAVVMPAVLAGVYLAANAQRSLLPLMLISAIALTETCAEVPLTSASYLWTAPAWLAWFLYASRRRNAPAEETRFDRSVLD